MRVGIAGLGLMGSGIANRLLQAGFQLSVYNRSPSKAAQFRSRATICETPAALAKSCEIVVTVVTDFDALQQILLGPDGVVGGAGKGMVLADVSTISPGQSAYCASLLRSKGIEMLGMPVMGGPAAAEKGELVPIVAGRKDAFQRARAVVDALGKKSFYLGETDGSANAIKLALNLNIGLIASALSEGIALVRGAGIEPSKFVEILNSTYFKTGLSEKKGPRMASGDFEPSFHLKNMLKDLELALTTAIDKKISLPQTALAHQLFRAASNSGYAEMDYTAICGFLAEINGMSL